MEGKQAMEFFNVVVKNNLLPANIDELVPLSFIGQAAVTFYRQKVKLMDQLKMTEEQRKITLKDGQGAGEMLLEIESRIGEIAAAEEKEKSIPQFDTHGLLTGHKPSGKPPKHERLGMDKKRMQQSQQIAKNPEIVEQVKAQAKANDDIPTKTAVLSEIRYQNEKKRRKEAEGKQQKTKLMISIDQTRYITALDKCARILPQKPPKDWNENAFKEAKTKAQILIKRLEVFNG